MDKETLSNYGWIVICVLVLAVMIALASPFGTFIADAVKSTTQGLFDTNKNALDAARIAIEDNGLITEIIPEGGTYYIGVTSETTGDYTGATITLTAGDAFPETVNDGDVYVYGDYEYRYNRYYWTYEPKWLSNDKIHGWGVRVLDTTKTTYGTILESVNRKPVSYVCSTFRDCTSLTIAPTIPNKAKNMWSTFWNCPSLKTYYGSTDPDGDFSNYVIPKGVVSFTNVFYNCKLLTNSPVIPNGVTSMQGAFYECTSLTTAPAIPSSVKYMSSTFENCTSLTTAPAIPNSVTSMVGTFQGCTSLTGTVSVPCNIRNTSWTNCPAIVEQYHYTGCGH